MKPSLPPRPPGKLPPDWQEFADPRTGKPFFRNIKTGESTWERPVMPTPTIDAK